MAKRKLKTHGFHYPGYNYCGPGTVIEGKEGPEPINEIDSACRDHDNDPNFSYIYFNSADEQLIREVEKHRRVDSLASDTISSMFRAKKLIAPRKVITESKGEDLPSNVISTNANRRTKASSLGSMYKRKRNPYSRRRLGPKAKRHRRASRKIYSSKKNRGSKARRGGASAQFKKHVIAALQADQMYINTTGVTYQLAAAEKSFWIDPHYHVYATRASTADRGLAGNQRLLAIATTLFGAAPSNVGDKYLLRSGLETFRISNFSNTKMSMKIYYITCKDHTATIPITHFDDGAFPAGIYTGDNTTSMMSNIAAAGHFAGANTSAKNVSIYRDVPDLLKYWKITAVKKLLLMPMNHITVLVQQPKMRLLKQDPVVNEEFERGVKRIIIRIDTELTADGTVTSVAHDGVNAKGYGFAQQSLVIHQSQKVHMAIQPSNKIEYHIDNVGPGAGADSNVGTDPRVVGLPTDDDGAGAQADIS